MRTSSGLISDQLAFWTRSARDTGASWRAMASPRTLAADLSAGLSVACVALPLNLALATAMGVPPGQGLITGIVAGVVAGLLSGSRMLVTGPEAALVPMGAAIVAAHGAQGLAVAAALAGLMQIAFGLLRFGRLVRLMPVAVVRGFTVGIGLLLLGTQLPRFLGLSGEGGVAGFLGGLGNVHWAGVGAGAVTMLAMIVLPRVSRKIPAVLAGLVAATVLAAVVPAVWDLVGELPRTLPAPELPSLEGLSLAELLPAALGLAFLSSLGSLLASVSLDAVTRETKSGNVDQELVAQGLANVVAGLFGGVPVMGAIVRATASLQAGARTRAASVFHGLWLLGAMVFAAPLVARVPTAALAAILVVVGLRLVDLETLMRTFRESKVIAGVVIITALAIVFTDFIIGVGVGLVVACIAYLARYGRLHFEVQRLDSSHALIAGPRRVEDGQASDVLHGRVSGLLCFLNHMELYRLLDGPSWPRVVVLDLSRVSYVDGAAIDTLRYVSEFLKIRGSHFAVVYDGRVLTEQLGTVAPVLLGQRVHEKLDDVLRDAGLLPAPAWGLRGAA